MASFVYASWNMKNLSTNSILRLFTDFETSTSHANLTAYINTIKKYKLDIMGIIEVTIGTGEDAVKQIATSIANWSYIITADRTFITRKGEYNAVVFNHSTLSGKVEIGSPVGFEYNFPQTTSGGTSFLNRVPVLFSMNLAKPSGTKKLQIITWHAPQPKHVDPENELKALAESIDDLIKSAKIDKSQPLMISGDFNFNTDPKVVSAWDTYIYNSSGLTNSAYIKKFGSLLEGESTTLVAKDPATYATKPKVVLDFGDLLANAYDNIIINENNLELISDYKGAVINHLKEFVAEDKITFVYKAPGSSASTQMEIKNANKISDHCAIYAELEIK